MSFDFLCKQDLGAADYGAIAHEFPTVIIDRIPRLSLQNAAEARRFIILVDELYEHKARWTARRIANSLALPDLVTGQSHLQCCCSAEQVVAAYGRWFSGARLWLVDALPSGSDWQHRL